MSVGADASPLYFWESRTSALTRDPQFRTGSQRLVKHPLFRQLANSSTISSFGEARYFSHSRQLRACFQRRHCKKQRISVSRISSPRDAFVHRQNMSRDNFVRCQESLL